MGFDNLTYKEQSAREFYVKYKKIAKVSYDTFRARLERGYDPVYALTHAGRIKPKTIKKINKKTYKNNKEILNSKDYQFWLRQAEINNIDKNTYYRRVTLHGWTFKSAATVPKRGMKIPQRYIILANKNEIDRKTFRHRVVVLGWDYEKAATTPIAHKKHTSKSTRTVIKEEIENKVVKQIKFYHEKGLKVPKKYIKYAKENNLVIN